MFFEGEIFLISPPPLRESGISFLLIGDDGGGGGPKIIISGKTYNLPLAERGRVEEVEGRVE